MSGPSSSPPATGTRRIFWSGRAVAIHVTLLVLLPAFAALCWWQVRRALSGNELSWAYVFEWPLFGAYAVFVWWKLLRDVATDADAERVEAERAETEGGVVEADGTTTPAPAVAGSAARPAPNDGGGEDEEEDEELAAYNRYLAELEASGRRKHW